MFISTPSELSSSTAFFIFSEANFDAGIDMSENVSITNTKIRMFTAVT